MFRSKVPIGFRKPRGDEARLLQLILAGGYAGGRQLRAQLEELSVASIDGDGSLRLSTQASEPATVDRRVPVEASYLDRDGTRVHLLVHVSDGYLDELEVYREDSSPVLDRAVDQQDFDFDMY